MPMPISTLEILEQSQMPPAHARAIAKAMELDAATRREDLATKTDLQLAFAGLKDYIHQVRDDLKDDLYKTINTQSFRMYLAILAQMAATISVMYYLLEH